jgi:hypothetical protein
VQCSALQCIEVRCPAVTYYNVASVLRYIAAYYFLSCCVLHGIEHFFLLIAVLCLIVKRCTIQCCAFCTALLLMHLLYMHPVQSRVIQITRYCTGVE